MAECALAALGSRSCLACQAEEGEATGVRIQGSTTQSLEVVVPTLAATDPGQEHPSACCRSILRVAR